MTKDQIYARHDKLKRDAAALRFSNDRELHLQARRRLLRFQAEHEATLRQMHRWQVST